MRRRSGWLVDAVPLPVPLPVPTEAVPTEAVPTEAVMACTAQLRCGQRRSGKAVEAGGRVTLTPERGMAGSGWLP
jgi:hypothetical protein